MSLIYLSISSDGVMVVYGELMDRIGPRVTFGCGLTFAWLGLALLSMGCRDCTESICTYVHVCGKAAPPRLPALRPRVILAATGPLAAIGALVGR